MAKRKKTQRIPEKSESALDMCITYSAVGKLHDIHGEIIGGMVLEFGGHYVEVLINEEIAEGLIAQLEAFLDDDGPGLLDD